MIETGDVPDFHSPKRDAKALCYGSTGLILEEGPILPGSCRSERPSLRTVADHIICLWKRSGEDMCAIGTDYFGLLDHPEHEGLEDITRFAGLWDELVGRGMRSVIEKVSGNNALRAIEINAQRWK